MGASVSTVSFYEVTRLPRDPDWRTWSSCRLFTIAISAFTLAAAIGVLIVSLVFFANFYNKVTSDNDAGTTSPGGTTSTGPSTSQNVNFQFLFHLGASQEYLFPGGSFQCARYRRNATKYSSVEEMAFGSTLHYFESKISVCTLTLKPGALRVPNWSVNANVHGFVTRGTVWIGVVEGSSTTAVTYNASAAEVIFFPRNRLYWIKNIGAKDSTIVLFYSTHEELFSLGLDDVFTSTPEDILARALTPFGGINCIKAFHNQTGGHVISPSFNVLNLIPGALYPQSANGLIWKYLYNLRGARRLVYRGGLSQWARCYTDTSSLSTPARIFSNSLITHEDTLGLQILLLRSTALLAPHFHGNANKMAYVIRGCGKVGIFGSGMTDFDIGIGDVVFFPTGMQHYIKSTCDEDLLMVLAYSTCGKLDTLIMDYYIHALTGPVLAQLFGQNVTCLALGSMIYYNVTILEPGRPRTTTPRIMTTSTTTEITTTPMQMMSTTTTSITTTTSGSLPDTTRATTAPTTTMELQTTNPTSTSTTRPGTASSISASATTAATTVPSTTLTTSTAPVTTEEEAAVSIEDPDAVSEPTINPATVAPITTEDPGEVVVSDPDAVPEPTFPDDEDVIVDDPDAVPDPEGENVDPVTTTNDPGTDSGEEVVLEE